MTGFATVVLLGATGFVAGVLALALTFSVAVLAAFAATARFFVFLPATAALALALAAGLAAGARATLRAPAAVRRVAVARAGVLAVVSFAVDLDFVVAVLEVIVLAVFAEGFALVFRLEAAAARAGLPAEAERLAVFFEVEFFAAADFVAPLLAARLATVFERAPEPLARAAAVEAVAGDFFSALLEGIRGLLLCCPAVETGPSLPDESRLPPAKKSRGTAKAARGNLASAAYPTAGAGPTLEIERLSNSSRNGDGAGSPSTRRAFSV
ncbi:MAG TPA: hypothetical protein VIF88_12330 [Methylocystis sp.]